MAVRALFYEPLKYVMARLEMETFQRFKASPDYQELVDNNFRFRTALENVIRYEQAYFARHKRPIWGAVARRRQRRIEQEQRQQQQQQEKERQQQQQQLQQQQLQLRMQSGAAAAAAAGAAPTAITAAATTTTIAIVCEFRAELIFIN